MNNDNSVDIRPSLGDILNGYQRESYRPETAIAEFVDNSTASYYQNKTEIEIEMTGAPCAAESRRRFFKS